MEEGKEPPNSKLFTIKRQMNKYKKKDAPPSDCNGDRVVTVSEFDYCMDNHEPIIVWFLFFMNTIPASPHTLYIYIYIYIYCHIPLSQAIKK